MNIRTALLARANTPLEPLYEKKRHHRKNAAYDAQIKKPRAARRKAHQSKTSRNNLIIRFEKNTALIAMTAETHHGKKVCSKKYNARKNA